ncbi:AAA family ATPase [Algibacter sp. L1A34]|uniref:AAA family ATPase n=1 Tax=Algibacter sp. L1A34 TaxID=2686365 RepID=UPI001E389543|nr:AAA family ATPase [Algibacter sp. L1A34]
MEIIQRIEKEAYQKKVLNKPNKKEFERFYKVIFDDKYLYDNQELVYNLKDGLSEEEIANVVFMLKSVGFLPFEALEEISKYIRTLENKYFLLFAYNGTGKTRLSMSFKDEAKQNGNADTLYFNAFTEDLFTWDNDLDNDEQRVLLLNKDSEFFGSRDVSSSDGKRLIETLDIDNKIRALLNRYADFNFLTLFDYEKVDENDDNLYWAVKFIREELVDDTTENIDFIKVSRGEENIFIWCFFLAICQLAIDGEENYNWVKYIYIDDPISSLDDNNTIAVASHLAQMLKKEGNNVKTIISSHHTLFFNVMCNELKNTNKYFLSKLGDANYTLTNTSDTPFFHHVSLIKDLHNAVETNVLYTYHFNILRSVLEKTASFHGFKFFSDCIKPLEDDEDKVLYTRMVNILSHGNYSLYEPREMLPENKQYFKQIFNDFITNYQFNPEIIPALTVESN